MHEPWLSDDYATVYHGNCLEVLPDLPTSSVDAVACDPPYGLEFMGKDWDSFGLKGKQPQIGQPDGSKFRQNLGTPSFTDAGNPTCRNCRGDKYRNGPRKCQCDSPDFGNPAATQMKVFERWCESWARECLRVLKPGGHLLAFGGTRTYHRLAAGIEDAGFEIRDSMHWLYGSGFPKSLDVSKAIDKAAGAERAVVGQRDRYLDGHARQNLGQRNHVYNPGASANGVADITAPATEDAARWQGWGTALKPSHEPIVVARKPLAGTVAANVLEYGTGALNIDGCRVGPPEDKRAAGTRTYTRFDPGSPSKGVQSAPHDGLGRWPTNVVLSSEAADELDQQSGFRRPGERPAAAGITSSPGANETMRSGWSGSSNSTRVVLDNGGGASRYFPMFRYEAKADTAERPDANGVRHPTVKPLELMRWLVRLVTPPGGTVLDPFLGSGTTAEACVLEGFHCIGVEREADYLPLIKQRLAKPMQIDLFVGMGGDDGSA